jgi:hypothetical protein
MTSYLVFFGLSDSYQKNCKGCPFCVSVVSGVVLLFMWVLTGQLCHYGISVSDQKVCLEQEICPLQRIWKRREQIVVQ